MNVRRKIFTIVFLLAFQTVSAVWAVEVAPRITDREIIESLAGIKAEFNGIDQRFDQIDQRFDQVDKRFGQLEVSIDQRFKQVDQRFDQVDKRFGQLEVSIDQRFKQVDLRFEQIDKQFDRLYSMTTMMFGFLAAMIIALFGYIVWDRRTALKPLEERLNRLENDLVNDLQLRHDGGSLLTRFVGAMRELAKEDEQIAEVMRRFSLL